MIKSNIQPIQISAQQVRQPLKTEYKLTLYGNTNVMRKNLKPSVLLITLLLTQTLSFGQLKTYVWEVPMCGYEGTYDSRKYSEERIDGTRELCFTNITMLNLRVFAWKPEDLDSITVDSLDDDYNKRVRKIKKLKIIKSDFWEEVRNDKISRVNKLYELFRIMILGYKNPEVLKQLNSTDTCKYTDALIAGGQKLLDEWKSYQEEQAKHNGNPEWAFKEYYTDRFNSPQKLQYARIALMGGWWNDCARVTQKSNAGAEKIQEEFRKLFVEVKGGCQD